MFQYSVKVVTGIPISCCYVILCGFPLVNYVIVYLCCDIIVLITYTSIYVCTPTHTRTHA